MNVEPSPDHLLSGEWVRRVALGAGLALLLGANFVLRHYLEDSPRYLYSFLEMFYEKEVPVIFGELPRWRLFLPLPELTGAWVTTTLILTYLVERVLEPWGAWYLFNAVAILVAWGTSWSLFRSAVFSFTFAICVGFGTHYYHAYAVTGGIASYLLISYNMLLLFTFTQIVRGARPLWAWVVAFAGSLALNVLGYEGWLDVLVLIWVATPFAYVGLRRHQLPVHAARVLRLSLIVTLTGAAYVLAKVSLGFEQSQGAEGDVVFNYRSVWPIVDDVISNTLTHTYMSVSNFLPPMFVGASSLYRLGADPLIAAQHRYHEPFGYLVAIQQVFFWRYYAGAVFVILLGAIGLTARRVWVRPSAWTIALGVFLLMILVAGSTHTLVKYRPMKSMPVMTYHVTVGVLGMSLLLSWLVTTAWRTWHDRRRAVVLVALVWGLVFYGALARPPYLSHMSAQVGLGEFLYPNPMRALVEKLGGTYEAPRGLAMYRLMPYHADEGLARVRVALGDLPAALPPVEQWAPYLEDAVRAVDGGGIEVSGDDTQFGYQIMSPVIPVAPAARHILRVRFEVLDGRVCAGVLSGDQQRWLVAPDGSTAEYMFDTGDLDGIRVVVANCYGYDTGNPRSRFRLFGGSYAAIAMPGSTP